MGEPDPNAKPKPQATGGREARLAQALRENLRRRKAAKTAPDPSEDGGSRAS
jgi:hypothetical protein